MVDRIKILLVDDNMQMRNLLRITFSPYPEYELLQAQNGKEALDLIRDKTPEIMFLDIMMPGDIDGLDVCKFVKSSEYKSCFVVLLSARGQKSDVELGLLAGANMYITKPFSPLGLVEIVKEFQLNRN